MRPENPVLGTATTPPADLSQVRYGVYLRPSPEMTVTALTALSIARDLFGFQAATAYPPHVTLLGSVPVITSEEDFITAVGEKLHARQAVQVHNNGLRAEIRDGIGYDCNHLADGSVNQELRALYLDIAEATRPHRGFVATDWAAEKRRTDEDQELFKAHLTVVGHDGTDNPVLVNEAREALDALGLTGPAHWAGDTVTAYRLHSQDWAGRYWHTLQWVPLKSWHLS